MQNSNRQIKIGGIISYLTIGFSIVSGLIYTPWMISIIGQDGFGLYILATSMVTMMTIDLGLSSAVARFISKYKAENDVESIKKFLSIAFKLFILLAVIFLVTIGVVYFHVDQIFLRLSPEEIEKVKVLLAIAGLYAVFSFPFHPLNGLLVSGEWFIFQRSTQLLSKVLNVVLMVAALMLGYGLYSLVVVNAFCGIIIIAMQLHFLKKHDPQKIAWKSFDIGLTREIFSFSLWVMVISIAQRLILNITPSVLGITAGSKEIAVFSAAMNIEGYVWTFATVFGGMFLPKVSKLIYGDNARPGAIQDLMIKVGRIQFILLGAIVSIFLMTGRGFFLNWLGADFEKSYLIVMFLIIPGLVTIPQEIASTALIASNKVKYVALSRIIVAVISISLSYILSLRYGATGAGIAIFTGNLIGGVIVLNVFYARILKINVWGFFRKCQLSLALPFILVFLAGIALNYLINDVSWFNTVFKVLTLSVIYSLSAFFLAINSYEKGLILEVIRRFFKQ